MYKKYPVWPLFAGLLAVAIACWGVPALGQQMTNPDEYDVILKNGSIIDGTGNPWVSGDIAIRGDRIARIGKLDGARAKQVIDVKGRSSRPDLLTCWGNPKRHS